MSDIRVSVTKDGRKKECAAAAGANLLAVLKMNGFSLPCCGGRGTCGRCKIRYCRKDAGIPTASERIALSLEELRGGYRLACMQRVWKDCEIEECFAEAAPIEIVSDYAAARGGGKRCTAENTAVTEAGYMVAVDLGTTTIAMQAVAMPAAEGIRNHQTDGTEAETSDALPVLAQFSCMNPQRVWGSDVVSRIRAAVDGEQEALRTAVCETLSEGLRSMAEDIAAARGEEGGCGEKTFDGKNAAPKGIFIAGNTVMEHLLSGLCVEGLGSYPFLPASLAEQNLILRPACQPVTLLPGISAFVGADITAGLLACGFAREKEEVNLFLDLGTNGEMAVGNAERLYCTATAAGPAFEGGGGSYVPGADMVAVMADMLKLGIMDRTGLMAEPYFEAGYEAACAGKKVLIRQKDVRALQMAKAAVHAGILILLKEYGVTARQIGRVYLAGGFGYFLDVEKAAGIGLFPIEIADRAVAVGNTSLLGAYLYGSGEENRKAAKKLCASALTVNLAEHSEFEKLYLENLEF